jgi:hypothetical protein
MRQLLLLTCLGLCVGAVLDRPAQAANPPRWKVVGDKSSKDWGAVRINTSTGETWMADNPLEWIPLPETGAAPTPGEAGTYDCLVYYPAESDAFYAIRWNQNTGQIWSLSEGKWTDAVVKSK